MGPLAPTSAEQWWRLAQEKNYRTPPCEELDPPYDIKLVFVHKMNFSEENQQKLLLPELHFLTPICTISFVGCDFAPDPRTGGANSEYMY